MRYKTMLLGAAALLSVSAAQAADMTYPTVDSTYNWGGLYLGATIGAAQNTGHADYQYGNTSYDGGDWYGGWNDSGSYEGALWEDVDQAYIETGDDSDGFGLDNLKSWIDNSDSEAVGVAGSVFIGGQAQWDQLVMGAELRLTASSFGTSYSGQWNDTVTSGASAYCDNYNNYDCETYIDNNENWNVNWTGPNGGWTYDDDSSGGTAWVRNDWELSASTSYDALISGLVRGGFALDRVMVYGTAGVSGAEVTAKTDAHVLETGMITAQTDYGNGINMSASDNVYWSGVNTEQLVGYSVGGGVEVALTDSVTLRTEALYTDLGTIDVTGDSQDTDATYTVKQTVRNIQISAGLLTLF